jgi:hypothetical protein
MYDCFAGFLPHTLNYTQVLLQTHNHDPMACIHSFFSLLLGLPLTFLKMAEYVRTSTILEFFQYHRCIVFVTARNTCPVYVSHFSLSTCFIRRSIINTVLTVSLVQPFSIMNLIPIPVKSCGPICFQVKETVYLTET